MCVCVCVCMHTHKPHICMRCVALPHCALTNRDMFLCRCVPRGRFCSQCPNRQPCAKSCVLINTYMYM